VRFRDAHTHLAAGAADLADLDLRAVDGAPAVVAKVAAAASSRPPGCWIRGWGWDGERAVEDGALDRAAARHPVFLARRDGHAAWVNGPARAALALPSEVVVEAAFDDARRRLPSLSAQERGEALRRQARAFAASGIAAIDDFAEAWAPEVYAQLAARAELPLHVELWLPEATPRPEAEALRNAFPRGGGTVAVAGIKIFLDGTLEARTAALWEPYADAPSTRGSLRIDEHEAVDRVHAWASQGWPVAIHAIGDRAVSVALDALERAAPSPLGPHRIEHAQVVRVDDLPRFRAAGIIASVQPLHFEDDRSWREARLGTRVRSVAYPLASLARAGATLLFGSDWPVSSFAPRRILAAAIDRARGAEAMAAADAEAAASA